MIDLFSVFTTGGVLLFSKALTVMKFDIIDVFIKNVLLKQITSDQVFTYQGYSIAFKLANDLNLVFCAVYQEAFNVLYLDELLNIVKEMFVKHVWEKITLDGNIIVSYPAFDKHYAESEAKWIEKCKLIEKKSKVMRSFAETSKGKQAGKKASSNKKPTKTTAESKDEKDEADLNANPNLSSKNNSQEEASGNQDEITKNRLKLAKKFSSSSKKPEPVPEQIEKPSTKSSKGKDSRMWNVSENASSKEMSKLDVYTTVHGKSEEISSNAKALYLTEDKDDTAMKNFVESDYSSSDSDSEEENEKKKQNVKGGSIFSKLKSGIQNITGKKTLTPEDLEKIVAKFKEDLMAKNVAQEVAVKLCESLQKSLIDTKTEAFTSIQKTVKKAMEETLTQILTPKTKIDLISSISRKKDKKIPFSIVFIGVNGVGKSTNLAKVAYLLKTQGFKVMLAACDNFRAGAVEQIKHHGRCLGIPVFDRGYKEDSAIIAQKALKEAAATQMDVVLIDTAGRMQNNEPLMKSLGRLVSLNNPDLILFIGEAIAGNDGVDQLTNFNKSLIDNSPHNAIREIDGVLLSKFDTVDDKMGAAISMTYMTGKPIVFVGVGQKYTHLKKLNAKTVVRTLLQ